MCRQLQHGPKLVLDVTNNFKLISTISICCESIFKRHLTTDVRNFPEGGRYGQTFVPTLGGNRISVVQFSKIQLKSHPVGLQVLDKS